MTDTERIPYGEEEDVENDNGVALYLARETDNCHDCGVERGDLHTIGCDVEQCPVCMTKLLSCPHYSIVIASQEE